MPFQIMTSKIDICSLSWISMVMSISMSIILSKQSMNIANLHENGKDSTEVHTLEIVVMIISNTMGVPIFRPADLCMSDLES